MTATARDITPQECGDRLRKAIREAGYESIPEAAQACGVHNSQLKKYLSGRNVPSWAVLVTIATKLGLEPSTLFPEFFGRKPKR